MSIRDDFFAAKAKGSLWDVAVSIKRGNPLPLDADSIFESYAALEAYAADVLAYPGQVVAVVNADSTGIYYLDQDLAIQPVGVIPVGDDKTIEVSEAGAISLLGAAGAANGTLPMIDSETGKLVWKTLEDIGAGDGNDNTTYEFNFANEKITITPKFNGIAQDAIELDLSTFVTADELAEELGKLVDNDTTYSVAEGEKVLKLNDTVFSTEIGLKHENGKISLTGINGAVIAEFSDADFVKDSVLEDVAYDAESKEIVFTWKTVDGETKTDAVSVADFVQVYTAGNGLDLNANEFSVKVDSESESFLTVGANGVKFSGVQTAIDTAKQAAIDDAATKYATTRALSQLETDLDTRLDALEAIDHTLYATKEELTPVKQTADNAAAKVETLEDKIEEITSVGGEPNVIDYIKVNGTILEVEKDAEGKSTKTVNIAVPTKFSDLTDDSGFDARITAAKTQADKGVTDAAAADAKAVVNAENIGKHETRIGNLETTKGDHETRIINLENADKQHASEYSTLKGIVDGHTTELASKAAQSDLNTVSSKVTANETAIKTLNDTTIPAVNAEINKKANATDVYTKTEVNNITGTVAEGKTLVQMIDEAKGEATYDDSAVRELIQNNTNAVNAIYNKNGDAAATGILPNEIARVEGLVNAEKARAEGIEADHEKRIADMETFWDAADDPEGAIDKLAEIINYIEADKTGALDMAADIQANRNAISAIYAPASEGVEASGVLVTEISRIENKADANALAIEAINNVDSGILAQANAYTDTAIAGLPAATVDALGLVKFDDSTIKMNDSKQLYVAKVSTDILEQGSQTLILNGGSATE